MVDDTYDVYRKGKNVKTTGKMLICFDDEVKKTLASIEKLMSKKIDNDF